MFSLYIVPLIAEVVITPEDTELVISWTYNHTGGFSLLEVFVEFAQCSTCSNDDFELVQDGNLTNLTQTSVTFPGELLVAGLPYMFQVTASNELGRSDPVTAKLESQIGELNIIRIVIQCYR